MVPIKHGIGWALVRIAPVAAMTGCSSGDASHEVEVGQDTRTIPVMVRDTSSEPAPIRPRSQLPADAGAFLKCAPCHSLHTDVNGLGPSLAGVVGRRAASVSSYPRYSDAIRESGLIWDVATLDRFLENPKAVVPGTKMLFAGLANPAQRAQVIAFLERH